MSDFDPQGFARAIRWLRPVNVALNGTSTTMLVVGMFVVLGVSCLTVADVISRQLGRGSVPGATEYAEVMLCAIVFLGMLPAETARVHVRTPILIERLSDRLARAATAAGLVISVGILLWMTEATLATGIASANANEVRFGIAAVPLWQVKLLIPVCLLALALRLLVNLIELIPGRSKLGNEIGGLSI